MSQIIQQLNQAKQLAFSNKDTFPQVLRQVLRLANNPDVEVQTWCASFFRESFTADDSILSRADKADLAIDALDALLFLVEIPNREIFHDCVVTAVVVYRLVFRFVADNDGCTDVWLKLSALTKTLVNKFSSSFPLPSDDVEHDATRSLDTKLELLKFIVVVIDYGSKSSSSSSSLAYSLNRVPTNHTLIKHSAVEGQSFSYLETILSTLKNDIMVAPLITATLNHLAIIMKRKPQFVPKILQVLENFDTKRKVQSNYQSLEEFKLSKKYVDRALKVLLNYSLRQQLVPTNYQQVLAKKVSHLIARGDEIRKKNILLPLPEDSNIKKRKFDGFFNSNKKLTTTDYKNLYCLTDPLNELNSFDLSVVPQNILVAMTLGALNKVSVEKLSKALTIVSERYKHTMETVSVTPDVEEPTGDEPASKRSKYEDDEDAETSDYNPESVYTLPPPKDLSFEDKKAHVNIIINNFFKLAEMPVTEIEEQTEAAVNGVDRQLTKVAIKSWKKDSWLVLLTRLATRGMRGVDPEDTDNASSDALKNNEMSDMIRKAIFDHFLNNIHSRIDLIIEWLSEEWYSEKVFNEEKIIEELTEKHTKDGTSALEIPNIVRKEVETMEIPTPTYNLWAGRVLDAMIPFLEPNDRKIFIRLLSDLPYLNDNLVLRIKSLCFDPVRSKIGFLSLQFLIMYRPPVKQACIGVLEELSTCDQEDLRDESSKLLQKYK